MVDRSTMPLEMLGEPDDAECPHGIPTGMGVECWECRYEQLNHDHVTLEDDYAILEQRCRELEELCNKAVEDVVTKAKRCRELENTLIQYNSFLEAIENFLQEETIPSDFMMSFASVRDVVDRITWLQAENEKLRKRLERKHDFLSQALNEGDGVYRP